MELGYGQIVSRGWFNILISALLNKNKEVTGKYSDDEQTMHIHFCLVVIELLDHSAPLYLSESVIHLM